MIVPGFFKVSSLTTLPLSASIGLHKGQTQTIIGTFSVFLALSWKLFLTLNLTKTTSHIVALGTIQVLGLVNHHASCALRLEIRLGYFSIILHQRML